MKMLKKKLFLTFCLCMLLLAFSCDNAENEKLLEQEKAKIEKLKNQLVEITGFNPNTIIYNAKDKTFIAEGDMIFTRKEIESYTSGNDASTFKGRTEHYRTKYLVDRKRARDIRVAFDNNFAKAYEWPKAASMAIDLWNSLSSITILHFRLVTLEDQHDITMHVEMNDGNLTTLARASGPSILNDGTPGPDIYVNLAPFYKYPDYDKDVSFKALVLAHEMGHTIGLGHTDGVGNNTPNAADIFIYGTPTSDPYSIMNSKQTPTCPVFTPGDKDAIKILYPY